MGPNDCEDCCIVCCCSTVGYICCCRPMLKATRIKLLWAWLIVLSLTSAIIIACAVYSPLQVLASPSDMISIRDHVDFLYCEEVNIVSPGLRFNGYLISGDLKIDQTKTAHTKQNTALFVGVETYNYFAFYFLERSSVIIKHCVKEMLTFYIIIGRTNFEDWKKSQFCDDCYFYKEFIKPKSNCIGDDKYETYTFNAIVQDEYFIVYSNQNYNDAWVNLQIDLDRTIYDLQTATTVCFDATECDIILDSPGETAVIWVKNYYDFGQYNHPKVSTKCIPRIWAYCIIHGVPVLLIGICFSVVIQKVCRDPSDNSYNIQTERSPLLYNSAGLPPSYSAVLREPPKYEDIIRTCEPPPYSEVLAGLDTGQIATTFIDHIATTQTGHIATTQTGQIATTQTGHIATTQTGQIATTQTGQIVTTQIGNIATTQIGHIATTRVSRL